MNVLRWCAVAALALSVCAPVHAQRVIEARDGAVVRVAANEPNLIEATQGRVTAFVFTEGKFSETVDPDAGVVYFRPLEEGPRSGFVEVESSAGERSRYGLILVPVDDWPAQRIVLKPKQASVAEPSPRQQAHVPQSESHVVAIKKIMRMMLTGFDGLRESQPSKLVLGELTLTKLADYREQGLVGELHRIDNTSEQASRIDEARLHVDDDIVAVMVPTTSTLEPGGSTEVYLVRATAVSKEEAL